MKILTISDTHGLHNRISKDYFVEADMIIHAGDCSSRGYITEIELFFDWFNQLNYKYKIMIAGNHDFGFQENPDEIKRILLDYPDIIYLEDSFIEIEGIKIYGSPWQPYFHNWAFNLQRGEEIQKKWDLIPKDVNILITHGPVKDILDFVPYNGGEFVGCQNLKETILTLPDLKTHICGHIHCGYGEEFNNGIHYINASCCTEQYEPIQKPILFEI